MGMNPPGDTPPPPPGWDGNNAPPPPPPGAGGPPQPPGYPPQPPPGGQPPPGYVPFGSPGMPTSGGQRTNGFAVASLVLGIVGILLCFLFIPWILAIIFGSIAIKQCNDDPTYSGKGLAIAGLVCGLVGAGLILWALLAGDGNFDYNLGTVVATVQQLR